MRGRLICSKSWNRSVKILEHIWTVRDSVRTVLGDVFIIYAINYVFVWMRPGMAIEICFKKWNKYLMSRLPIDSPLALF